MWKYEKYKTHDKRFKNKGRVRMSVGVLHTLQVSFKVSLGMPGLQNAAAHPHFTH